MQDLHSFPPFGALRHHLSPKGKRVTGFSGHCVPLQIQFPCHPAVRGHNKAPYNIPLISGSTLSTGCCPTACGVARELESHQRTGFVGERKRPENPVSR